MAEGRKRGATAEERLAELQRDRERLHRERLLRQVAGPRWHRMARIVPVLFRLEGKILAHVLRAERAVVIEALKQDGVFALDTAMRLAHGYGFLAVQEIQVYLTGPEPLDRLARQGMIGSTPHPDTTLIRPWAGPPRLLACIVERLPPSRRTENGYQVVTSERLGRELIGAVGPRADLFALYERAEGRRAPSPAGA